MFRHKKSLWIFLLPGLLGILLFYVVPLIWGLIFSFTDGRAGLHFVGLRNYTAVLSNLMFMTGLKNTLLLTAICVPVVCISGFFLAAVLNRVKDSGEFLRNTIFLPYVMPSSAIVLIWLIMFDYGGPVNRLIFALGGERMMFLSGMPMRLVVVLMFVWKNLGFTVIIMLSAMQGIPKEYYEYARMEGAGFFKQCHYITLPCIIPTCLVTCILECSASFKIFKEIYFISGSYPDMEVYTLQHYMNNMYSKLNYPYAAAAAYTFTLILCVLFSILILLQQHSYSLYEGSASAACKKAVRV